MRNRKCIALKTKLVIQNMRRELKRPLKIEWLFLASSEYHTHIHTPSTSTQLSKGNESVYVLRMML